MIIRSRRVVLADGIKPASLELCGDKIACVSRSMACDADYGDRLVCPGFVDIHYHGCYGSNVMDKDPGSTDIICQNTPREGTTSFLGTTTSAPKEDIKAALKMLGGAAGRTQAGRAQLLGVHLEGPFLDPDNGGAQSPAYMLPGDTALMEEFIAASGGTIRRTTISPEIPNAAELIEFATARGLMVSVGHSAAGYEQSKEAITRGARCATHTLNKMSTIMGRDPGLLGAVLLSPEVYCEVIADGVHLHYDTIKLICRMKNSDRIILVTDSNMAKGMPTGSYSFNGREVFVDKAGTARLVKNNSLAGSTAKMNICLRNMVQGVGIPLFEAVMMASRNPAVLIGAGRHKGTLAAGFDADITILDDNFNVTDVYCRGIAAKLH